MPETGFVPARTPELPALESMRGTAVQGGRLIRRNPLLLLVVAIEFFIGASDEGFDRLWEAHFLIDVGVPDFAGLDQIVWFGVLAAGATLLAYLVARPLGRRFAEHGPARMVRVLAACDALQIVGLLAFAGKGLSAGRHRDHDDAGDPDDPRIPWSEDTLLLGRRSDEEEGELR